jgi:hypothetical protein
VLDHQAARLPDALMEKLKFGTLGGIEEVKTKYANA